MRNLMKSNKKGVLVIFLRMIAGKILSPIMTDKKIAGFDKTRFLSVIRATLPALIITSDGETYRNEVRRSKYVMEKSLVCIDFLLENGIKSDQLIGLVLGSNLRQIDEYISELKKRNITKFCFHTGDFRFRRGMLSKRIALEYARYIRHHVRYLMLYGGGCRRFFQQYHFADAFITQSHFVAGFKHKKICRNGQKKYDGELSWDFIMSNLSEIYHYHFYREDHMTLPIDDSNELSSQDKVDLNENITSQPGGD